MTQWKAIATITWQFDSDDPHEQCLSFAKRQLDSILEEPFGEEFDGFSVQMDIARMKDRKKLVHLAEFTLDEVLPHITLDDAKREYVVDGKSYLVRMNSDRYFVFAANRRCVSCGLEGSKMMLDINPGDQSPHFNLYAEEKGRLILMTKDHILAKSKGGQDEIENYETTCSVCNNLKGNYGLSYDQVRELREIHNNQAKLPRKELRDLINTRREEMAGRRKGENSGCNPKRNGQNTH